MECNQDINLLIESQPDNDLSTFDLQELFEVQKHLEQKKSDLDSVLSFRINQFEPSSSVRSSQRPQKIVKSLGESKK